MNPVRVGFWSPVLGRAGGTETWHATLLPGLAYDPRIDLVGLAVLEADECDPDAADLLRAACPVTCGWHALAEVAAASDVLVWWGIAHPATFLAGPNPRPRTVAVSHGDGSFPWTASTLLACSDDADRYVGVSDSALESVPPDRVKDALVIWNAVDPVKFAPGLTRAEQRARWGVPPGAKVVGMVSRISDEKDPKALARCVAALPPEWYGVAVGDGPNLVETQAHAFGTAGTRVFFPGATHDVASAYGAFDVLLCPSTSEGFGLVIVEGLANRLPVVSTPVGITRHPDVSAAVAMVPVGADGATLAAAVMVAARARTSSGRAVVAERVQRLFSAAKFVVGWADFLVGLAG